MVKQMKQMEQMKLKQLADILTVVNNDAHLAHLYAYGERFDRIHDLMKELYDNFQEDYDLVAELAIENNEEIENASDAARRIEWPPLDLKQIDWELSIKITYILLTTVISGIDACFNKYNESVDNAMGDMRQKYSKMLSYKLKRRIKEN